jgi:hypothetical protein
MAAVNRSDPQTWNQYSYVRNSPLDRTDPLGLCDDWGCDDGGGWNDGPWSEQLPIYTGPALDPSVIIWNYHNDQQGNLIPDNTAEQTMCSKQGDGYQSCLVWDELNQLWDNTPEDKATRGLQGAMNNTMSAPFGHAINCAAALAYPWTAFLGPRPEDFLNAYESAEHVSDVAMAVDSEKLESDIERLRRWHKKSSPTVQWAKDLEWAEKGLKVLGAADAAKESVHNWNNPNGCGAADAAE